MNSVFRAAWNAMERYASNKEGIELDQGKENGFIQKCANLYDDFFKEYMSKNSKTLDRHKIGAILSIVASSDDYIKSSLKIKPDEFFLGRYSIPMVISLSFIEQEMNNDLKELNLIKNNETVKLHIPLPTSCKTEYIDSLARMLRFEEEKEVEDTLRVIELANTFFLIEECSLLKRGIDLKKWVELKRV